MTPHLSGFITQLSICRFFLIENVDFSPQLLIYFRDYSNKFNILTFKQTNEFHALTTCRTETKLIESSCLNYLLSFSGSKLNQLRKRS